MWTRPEIGSESNKDIQKKREERLKETQIGSRSTHKKKHNSNNNAIVEIGIRLNDFEIVTSEIALHFECIVIHLHLNIYQRLRK